MKKVNEGGKREEINRGRVLEWGEKEDIRVREREEGEIWTQDWGEGGAL